jgi:hypothetical protein
MTLPALAVFRGAKRRSGAVSRRHNGPLAPLAPRTAALAVCFAAVALAARPAFVGRWHPTLVVLALFAVLFVVGGGWPIGRQPVLEAIALRSEGLLPPEPRRAPVVAVFAVGVVAFGVARILGGGGPAHAMVLRLVALNTLAAVAEEAIFRRLAFALLSPLGPSASIVGSASMFAAVHIGIYGLRVVPLDFAAGLLLGWQRLASRDWRVPAATHAIANLFVVL